MRHRVIDVAIRLTTAALWAVGLSPAFFAVVVWDHPLPGVPLDWNVTSVQLTPSPWRLYAGELYEVMTITLLSAVLVCSPTAPGNSARRPGAGLVAAGMGIYAGPVLSGFFGGHGGAWDWRLWLAPLALAALYVAPPIRLRTLLWHLRAILRFYTWGSLCALAVAPEWALATSYIVNLRLPGIGSSRLLGLTNHPILLGVLATAALAVELAPLHRSRLWPLHGAVATAVLLLAQSRTAWVAALVGIPLLYRRSAAHRVHPLLSRGLTLGISICSAALVPTLMDRVERITSDPEVTSLHGRTEVWDMAMSAFRSNIVWGYGPTLFTDRSSLVHGAYAHAHSQLYQTLGTSGLVGAAGLSLFVVALVVAAARTGQATAGLSWTLVGITLATSLTEAPLRSLEFSPFLVLVFVDIALLLAAARSAEAEPGPTAVPLLPSPGGYTRFVRSAANSSDAAGCIGCGGR